MEHDVTASGFCFSLKDFSDEEWELREAEIAEYERNEQERAEARRYQRNVPERYWRESMGTFKTDTPERERQLEVTRDFINAVKRGMFRSLVFVGAVGTGKTHLACAMVRECGGLYRIAPDIVEEIRRAKSFTARETEAEILRDYSRATLLVVDEIGRGTSAQDEQYMLYQIINGRYNTRKPTVLISNHTKKDFINYIGIAAADRLSESALTVEFTGASYRAALRQSEVERR